MIRCVVILEIQRHSRHHEAPIEGTPESPAHYPIMPRDANLSDSQCKFFQSGNTVSIIIQYFSVFQKIPNFFFFNSILYQFDGCQSRVNGGQFTVSTKAVEKKFPEISRRSSEISLIFQKMNTSTSRQNVSIFAI